METWRNKYSQWRHQVMKTIMCCVFLSSWTPCGGLKFAYIIVLFLMSVGCNQAAPTATPTTMTTTITATTLKSFGEHSYWLIRDASGVTWYQATGYCRRQYGGRLAIVDDVDKIAHITNELTSLSFDITPAWLGAKSNESLHDWITLNGSVIITGNGKFAESNEDGNCLALTSAHYRKIFCSSIVGFYLCDIPRQPDLSQCYSANCLTLFNATEFNWFDARRECIKAGGDLASVLYADKLMEQREELQNKFIIIGGYRRPWWWMSDATSGLKEVMYYNWIDGLEKYSENSCLATTSSGWQPIKCNDTTTYFICEASTSVTRRRQVNPSTSVTRRRQVNPLFITTCCLAVGMLLLLVVSITLGIQLRRVQMKVKREAGRHEDGTIRRTVAGQEEVVNPQPSSQHYQHLDFNRAQGDLDLGTDNDYLHSSASHTYDEL